MPKELMGGMALPDEDGSAVVSMVCEPSSHDDRIMTGSARVLVLIGQQI